MTEVGRAARIREWRRFRALLRVSLWTALRPRLEVSTGKVRMRPLRALILSYTLMGGLFASSAQSFADLRSYAILFFASVLAIGVFSLVPDAEQQRRAYELIDSKPIPTPTLIVARAAHVLVMMTMMVVCLATPPLVYASEQFDVGPGPIIALFFALLLALYTAAIAWSLVQLLLMTRLPPGRIRAGSQVLLTMVVVAFSCASLILRVVRNTHHGRVALDEPLWRLFPPAWFVDLALGDFGLVANLERGAAFLLLAASLALFAWVSRGELHARLMERILEPAFMTGRASLGVLCLSLLKRSAILRRIAVPPATCGVASLILNHAPREHVLFVRLVPLRVLLGAAFAADVFVLHGNSPTTGVLGAMLLVDGVRLITQSPVRGADWVLRAAPLRPAQVLDGIRTAAWIGFFAFPLALSVATVLIHRTPLAAMITFLAYALEGHIMISLATGIDPAWPLSREQHLPVFFGYLIGWPVIGVLQALRLVFIEQHLQALAYLVVLAGVAWGAKAWSLRRFAAAAEV